MLFEGLSQTQMKAELVEQMKQVEKVQKKKPKVEVVEEEQNKLTESDDFQGRWWSLIYTRHAVR
jgi:hypothetical protein